MKGRNYHLNEALKGYLEQQSWQIAHIQEGLADLDAGRDGARGGDGRGAASHRGGPLKDIYAVENAGYRRSPMLQKLAYRSSKCLLHGRMLVVM